MKIADFVHTARTSGRIMTVTFLKRKTSELRTMTCRCGVEKHEKGGGLAFNVQEHDLLSVWDLGAKGYRMIPLDGIVSVKMDGRMLERRNGELVELVPA